MKKVTYLFISFLSLFAMPAFGQEREVVKLPDGSQILKSMKLNNGLVLLTGNEFYFTNKHNWKITYYGPHMTAKYDVMVPNPKRASFYNSYLVASQSGENVYFIRHGLGGLMGSPSTYDIMHIDANGISKSFTLKRFMSESGPLNVAFADNEYLYYVVKDRDKSSHNKHDFPKLKFVRIDNSNKVSNIPLALPDPDPDATEWSYMGHTDVVSYFVSRTLDDDYKTQKYRVAVIDHDGKLQDDFKFKVDLKDGNFMAGYNYCNNDATHEADNHNIHTEVYSTSSYNGSTGTWSHSTTIIRSPNPEAFGNIVLDPLTSGFYVYGLAGSGPPPKTARRKDKVIPAGYYVYKFDPDGKEVWKNEGKFTVLDEFYKNKASFINRQLTLGYGSGGNLRFQVFCRKNISTYEFNPETGAFTSAYMNTFLNPVTTDDLGSCHKQGDKSNIAKLLSKPDKADFSVLTFRMAKNNIVVRNFYHDAKLEMYDVTDE